MNSVSGERCFVLALIVLLGLPILGHGQTTTSNEASSLIEHPLEQAPLCDPDLIDAIFTYADEPAGEQMVSLHFQNKSNAACRLHGPVGSSFAVDSHSMVVESCWLCDANGKPSPMPDKQLGNQILLVPGGTATLDLQWASVGNSCQWADWVDFQFYWMPVPYFDFKKITSYLFIPSGWPMRICSAVRSSGYRPEVSGVPGRGIREEALRVSVLQNTIYSDERATLVAELKEKGKSVEKSDGCAILYTVRHAVSGGTRLDPVATLDGSFVSSYTPEQIEEDNKRAWPSWKTDFRRRCEIASGNARAEAEIPADELAHVTHIEWRIPPISGKSVFLIASTHFTVLDVDTLEPNWGKPVEGIRTGLSVDRSRFTLGERVPLHLRWENVSATVPLGQGECGGPQPALEILNSQHEVLKTIPTDGSCMGHGWGPFVIPTGKPQRNFRELNTASLPTPAFSTVLSALPGPGIYYLVSIWSPHVLEDADKGAGGPQRSFGRFGNVYATARSLPVRIEIVPASSLNK